MPDNNVSKKQGGIFSLIGILFLLMFSLITGFTSEQKKNKKGSLKITFINIANGKRVVLADSIYTNPYGETYTITKLRYYISNIYLNGNEQLAEHDNYQLINEPTTTSFTIPVKAGKYNSIKFLLGVDSIKNCSGIQDGALDPMNDMFWTWNSGYVMFKLEGISQSSPSVNHRIEHHIGGYRFGNKVATPIVLNYNEIFIEENNTAELFIEMNLDKYWLSANNIKIAEMPVCTLPGELAKKVAANFSSLFSIKNNK